MSGYPFELIKNQCYSVDGCLNVNDSVRISKRLSFYIIRKFIRFRVRKRGYFA